MTDYLDWRDLLDADDASASDEAEASDEAALSSAPGPAASGSAAPELPPELQALLAEKTRLEDELRAMTGQAKKQADPEDARRDLCFPVKVHTKESRIEERRLRRHDEHLRLLAQRAAERAAAERRLEERRALEAAERRREWLQDRLAAIAAAEAAEIAAAEVAARAAAEAAARAAAEAAARRHWAEQRRHAALARAAEARRASAWNEARHDARLAATAARTQARDREQALLAGQAEQARADRVAAATGLVQSRRREARALERHLDERNRRE